MARAVVEGQAFAHLAMIASDRQDERWLCDVEQAARARSSEQLRLEISSLREGAAPGADAADKPPEDTKSALIFKQLAPRGVAAGAVDDAAIAAVTLALALALALTLTVALALTLTLALTRSSRRRTGTSAAP